MSLFDWLFGVGDTVEVDDGGKKVQGKVRGFKNDGGTVEVEVPDGRGGSKVVPKFGGKVEKVDGKKKS